MIRRIIEINEEKCNGCGACASACHEGAIGMVNGKAKLLRDDYCDGLGDCLPTCPTGAITFVEREAADYDEAAVLAAKAEKAVNGAGSPSGEPLPCGCPGTAMKTFNRDRYDKKTRTVEAGSKTVQNGEVSPELVQQLASMMGQQESELRQWPVQIKLVPVTAPWFDGAKLLVAADCTAYAYGNFHQDFIRDHVVLVGCTKLDDVDYSEKLARIFMRNDIKSITVARMEVPCCGGLEFAAKKAIAEILLEEGYIKSFQLIDDGTQGVIRITLKYLPGKEKAIQGLRRVSKPGLRVYAGADELPQVLRGLGIAIISTSKGIMTDKKARAQHVGGEVLAFVW